MKYFMKLIFLLLFALVILASCVSTKPIYGVPMISKELDKYEIIGFIETEFEALNGIDKKDLLQKGYNELLNTAKKQYTGRIGIRNIILTKRMSGKNFTVIFGFISADYYINVYAKGTVIKEK